MVTTMELDQNVLTIIDNVFVRLRMPGIIKPEDVSLKRNVVILIKNVEPINDGSMNTNAPQQNNIGAAVVTNHMVMKTDNVIDEETKTFQDVTARIVVDL